MSSLLRSIVAVVLGYAIFIVGTLSLFRVTGQDAHAEASMMFMVLSTAGGVLCAFIGGYVAALIAGQKPFAHGIATAMVVAAGATASLISTIGNGAIWSQIVALALMAPSAALGGWVRSRKTAA